MRATGLNTFGYRKQMKEWLDLSMQKQIPISLLIMSRAFVLKSTEVNAALFTAEETLKTSLSAMEDDVVNEVIVDSARSEEALSLEMKQRKLDSIKHQNEVSWITYLLLSSKNCLFLYRYVLFSVLLSVLLCSLFARKRKSARKPSEETKKRRRSWRAETSWCQQ
jgi:hypothetical protein